MIDYSGLATIGAWGKIMIIKKRRDDVAVIVLTHNAGGLWTRWIQGIKQQTILAGKYLVIDSSSSDQTVAIAKQAKLDVFSINPENFCHGGTRQLAAELCPDAKFLVYLTQDAILSQPDSLEKLLKHFENPDIALAYGRHIPRKNASILEKYARNFTYPATSSTRSLKDVEKQGFKAAFSSDVYAAYRVSALRSVGGFPRKIIVSEDSYVSARLLQAGWKIHYAADSEVEHSHQHSLLQLFHRYYDIGVFQASEQQLFNRIGKPDSEGARFVKSQIRHLKQHNKWLIPYALIQTLVKYIAYQSGKRYEKLPNWLNIKLSAQKAYWNNNDIYSTAPISMNWVSLDTKRIGVVRKVQKTGTHPNLVKL